MNQFPRTRSYVIEKILASRYHHTKIVRHLVAHQAVNNKKAYCLIDRHAPIRIRFHFKTLRSSPFVNEDKGLRMNEETLHRAMANLETPSADHEELPIPSTRHIPHWRDYGPVWHITSRVIFF